MAFVVCFTGEIRFFSVTQPSLQTSACEKAKCWRSALRLATLHSTKEGNGEAGGDFCSWEIGGLTAEKATPPQNHIQFFLVVSWWLFFCEIQSVQARRRAHMV